MYVFGKAVETRHGNFSAGQPLPPEWDTRETRKQLVEQFGKDVLTQAQDISNQAVAIKLAEIESDLKQIKEALGLKSEAKKTQGQAKGQA